MTTTSAAPSDPQGTAVEQTGLFETMLELIRRTSTILPDDVIEAVTKARTVEEEGSNADAALDF